MSFDVRAFRTALGCFPTGVAVVTVKPSDRDAMGITVNSFASVSLDPPLLLWCLDRNSDRFDAFTTAPGFAISILGIVHETVSSRLAKRGMHRLDGIDLLPTEIGAPALADALAVFECASEAVYPGGDHAVLIGRVLRFACRHEGEPLVFFRGRYGELAERRGEAKG